MQMSDLTKSGIGLGLSFVLSSQIYPFMLSSAFTARTLVHEKDQTQEVIEDVDIALILSVAASLVLSFFLHDWITAIGGTLFSFILFYIYLDRGDLM